MKTLKKLTALSIAVFAAATANAQDITVKNAVGEQIVPQNPQKVVVLDFGVADTIRALGDASKIVGFPKAGHIPAYLAEFNQDKFKDVGTLPEPAFEAINELNPDLIIAAPRQQKLLDKLKEIAPVFYVQNDYANYYPRFQENVTALGKIFNKTFCGKVATCVFVIFAHCKICRIYRILLAVRNICKILRRICRKIIRKILIHIANRIGISV